MSTSLESTVVIRPGTIQADPSVHSHWVRSFADFARQAAASGQTVTVVARQETFSPAEAASMLGVSRSTVQRAIDAGALRAERRGTYWRIPLLEIEALSAANTEEAARLFADDDLV